MIREKVLEKLGQAMATKLVDVVYDFTASGRRGDTNTTWNPEIEDYDVPHIDYVGELIGGLSFNKDDTEFTQIEVGDQKAILMSDKTSAVPQAGDEVVFDLGTFTVKQIGLIPANVGYILQLRSV